MRNGRAAAVPSANTVSMCAINRIFALPLPFKVPTRLWPAAGAAEISSTCMPRFFISSATMAPTWSRPFSLPVPESTFTSFCSRLMNCGLTAPARSYSGPCLPSAAAKAVVLNGMLNNRARARMATWLRRGGRMMTFRKWRGIRPINHTLNFYKWTHFCCLSLPPTRPVAPPSADTIAPCGIGLVRHGVLSSHSIEEKKMIAKKSMLRATRLAAFAVVAAASCSAMAQSQEYRRGYDQGYRDGLAAAQNGQRPGYREERGGFRIEIEQADYGVRGARKRLTVTYRCGNGGMQRAQADEGDALTLGCQ